MTSSKYPELNILIIIAMVLSLAISVLPAAPVHAAVTACHVTGVSPATVGAGGTIGVTFTATTDNELEAFSCQAFMELGTSYYSMVESKTGSGPHTLYITTPDGAGPGTYTVYVKVKSASATTYTRSDNSGSVTVDATRPTGSVSIAETCWSTTGTYTVTYSGAKTGETNLIYCVQLSDDNGANYNYTLVDNLTQTVGSHTVSVTPSGLGITTFKYAKARVQVHTTSTAIYSHATTSSMVYVLPTSGLSPSITSIKNASGSSTAFSGGENITIKGSVTASGTSPSYMLTLFPNGDPDVVDAVYENITAGWKTTTSGTTFTVYWKASTSVASTNCMIALYGKDCAGNVKMVPSSAFSISATTGARVRITYPISGSVIYTCATTDNISFNISGGTDTLTTCDFHYSTDNKTWSDSFYNGTFSGGSNSINFTHSGWTAGTYYLKIEAVNNSISTQGYSPSFIARTLTATPTLTISSMPDSLTGGTLQTITYVCKQSADTTAPIEYYFYLNNAGATTQVAHFFAKNGTGATSTFSWAVSNVTSANCKIKIVASDPCGNSVSAESNVFSITAGCATESYDIDLYPGWNLVSLPLIPISTNIDEILSNVMDNINSVYYYSAGKWYAYVPGVTSAQSTMEVGRAYWINIKGTPGTSGSPASAACTLTVNGRKCACGGTTLPTTQVTYNAVGWNLMGMKRVTAATLSSYWQSTCGAVYAMPIFHFDGATQTMLSETSCQYSMQPGVGYWFFINTAFQQFAPCE